MARLHNPEVSGILNGIFCRLEEVAALGKKFISLELDFIPFFHPKSSSLKLNLKVYMDF